MKQALANADATRVHQGEWREWSGVRAGELLRRRVAVTGVGLVSAVGIGADAAWKALCAGESGVGPVTRFDPDGFTCRIAAEVKGFDPHDWMERKDAKRVDRFVQFALAASRLALADSGLVVGGENRDRVAVDIGTTLAGLETIEAGGRELRRGGPRRVSPYLIPGSFPNLASGWVSIRTGARGGTAATSCEGATSAQALGHSLRRLEAGEVDAVLAGGAEAPITPLGMSGFAAMRALSRRNDEPRRASRPFAVDRDGFVLAEGATILVLEALECAQRRGARILCELSGYGCAAASGRGRRAFADAALRSMRLALADAGAGSDGIDYVSAHAVGSRADDRAEADALRSLFADRASPVIVGASKSMTGHALGAAGAMSAGIATLALARGVIPPTLNLERPDPRCISGRIPGRSLAFQARAALCVALGLGGVAASLVLRRYG